MIKQIFTLLSCLLFLGSSYLSGKTDHAFMFYGKKVNLNYDEGIIPEFPNKQAESVIANHVRTIDKTQYQNIHKQLIKTKRELKLNDWGYYQLVQMASNELTNKKGSNESFFLQWVLMLQSDYKALLGAHKQDLLLLLKFNTPVYEWTYYYHNNERYFIMNKEVTSRLAVYKSKPVEHKDPINLKLDKTPNLPVDKDSVAIKYNDQNHLVKYNQNLIAFYNDYPRTDLEIYFNAAIAPLAEKSLKTILQEKVKNKSAPETLSTLLAFVRKLPHTDDMKQFGQENYLFPPEVFYHGESDCEDRSFLLAYLIREFTHLDVVGLKYESHINIAVEYKWDLSYSKLRHNGKAYAICDPSLENSEVGESMHDQEAIIEVMEVK